MNKYSIQKRTTVSFQFPEPPAGEEWHNPEGASAAEVGEGYRLLTKHEQKLISNGKLNLTQISVFLPDRSPRTFDVPENTSCGISQYTYRVPDTTPITLSRLQYNPNKFYGAEDSKGRRFILAYRNKGFEMVENPCAPDGYEFSTNNLFDGWTLWAKNYGGEIKEFGTLLELANWMEGK
jgi:hypothetical protein